MKRLLFILALTLSYFTYGQSGLLQLFDSAIGSPAWTFNQTYNYPYLNFIAPGDFSEGYLYDSLFVAVAHEQRVHSNSNDEESVLVTMSAQTGKILWYLEVAPGINKTVISKYGVICSVPGRYSVLQPCHRQYTMALQFKRFNSLRRNGPVQDFLPGFTALCFLLSWLSFKRQ